MRPAVCFFETRLFELLCTAKDVGHDADLGMVIESERVETNRVEIELRF